jgi:hypothetical protein
MVPRPLLAWQLAHANVEPGIAAPLDTAAFIGAPEERRPVRYIFSPARSASLLGIGFVPVRNIRVRKTPRRRRQQTKITAATRFFMRLIMVALALIEVKRGEGAVDSDGVARTDLPC